MLATLIWVPVLLAQSPATLLGWFALALGINVTVLGTPVHVSLPQLVALVALGGIALQAGDGRVASPSGARWWAWSGALFVAAAIPSLVGAVSAPAAAAGMTRLLFLSVLMYVLTRYLTAFPDHVRRVIPYLAVGLAISILVAFAQSALGIGPRAFFKEGYLRVYSTYGQPNSYAQYLTGLIPLLLGAATQRRALLFPAALATIALLLTGSRGAAAATALSLLVLLALLRQERRARRAMGLLVFLGLVGLTVVLVLPPAVFHRFIIARDWAVEQRGLALLTAWNAILERPLLGYGPGAFQVLRPDIAVFGFVDDLDVPHNFAMEVWLEEGLPALLCLGALVIAYYFKSIRAVRLTGDPLLAGLVAAFTGLLTMSLTSTLLIRGVQECFVLIVAMTAARVVAAPGERAVSTPPPLRSAAA